MNEFIGHLHSLFLHLPIGFWILFILLDFFIGKQKPYYSTSILKTILIIGIISSFFALFTGYLQSKNDFYPSESIRLHQWVAYATTLVFICYYIAFEKIQAFNIYRKALASILLLLVVCTVYFGTSLTHGEDFIQLTIPQTSSSNFSNEDPKERPLIKDADPQILSMLQKNGWVITPLYKKAHYYKVSGYALTDTMHVSLNSLTKIAPNITELKLSFTKVDDTSIELLLNFSSLEKLWLDNTMITPLSLSTLSKLKNLEYLNLFGTSISEDEISKYSFSKKLLLVHPTFRDTLSTTGSDSLFSKNVKQ
jgi:hypothetical protein